MFGVFHVHQHFDARCVHNGEMAIAGGFRPRGAPHWTYIFLSFFSKLQIPKKKQQRNISTESVLKRHGQQHSTVCTVSVFMKRSHNQEHKKVGLLGTFLSKA